MTNQIVPTITPSNINELFQCAKRFHQLRVMRDWPQNGKMSASAQTGIAAHRVLRDVYEPANIKGDQPDLSKLDLLARVATASQSIEPGQRPVVEANIRDLVRFYVNNDDLEDVEGTLGVEVEGRFTVADANGAAFFMVQAKLDRVLVRASQPTILVVRDYKTSHNKPRRDLYEALIQLWVAKLLYPGYAEYLLELDHITLDGIERQTVTSKELKRLSSIVVAQVRRFLADPTFPPTRSEGCHFCPLKEACWQDEPGTTVEALESAFD